MNTLFLLLCSPFVGSFLGVLADRLPRGEPVAADRSRCRNCGRRLGAAELVPLLSWMALRGRCRGCGAAIPWTLPAMEAAALGVAVWTFAAVPAVPAEVAWATALLGWALLVLAAIDAASFWLPDSLSLPLLASGLLVNGVLAGGMPVDALIGAAAGWGLFAAVILVYRRVRGREGMGWGDAKLLAAGGAWVGWAGLPGVLLIAALAGLAGAALLGRRRADAAVPFGPALALGIWITWLYGPLVVGGG